MSLDINILKDEILKIIDKDNPNFVGYSDDYTVTATNWANAYDTYARNAEDISGDVLVTANKPGFIAALAAGLATSVTPASAAAAYEAAFVIYWTAATFSIGIPPVVDPESPCPNVGGNLIFGVEISSIAAPIPAVLGTLLTTIWNTPPPVGTSPDLDPNPDIYTLNNDYIADKLAQAFHTATTTAVIVTISGTDTTPPTAGPLPIVNICTVS